MSSRSSSPRIGSSPATSSSSPCRSRSCTCSTRSPARRSPRSASPPPPDARSRHAMTDPDGPAASLTGPEGSGRHAPDLTERVVDSRVLHRGHFMEFRVDTIERADGSRAKRDIVGHPGAVAIVALDEADRVLFVRQYRLAATGALPEIPAGGLDVDEASGAVEDPDGAARRELEEETGYRARTWRKLGSFWTAPGFATELMHLYLATDLELADADRLGPDEDERLELVRVPLADALAAAERGEIADAKSLVGLFWLDRLRRSDGQVASHSSGDS